MAELYLLTIAALAVAGIAASIIAIGRDGQRRRPVSRPQREYERDEHYRA